MRTFALPLATALLLAAATASAQAPVPSPAPDQRAITIAPVASAYKADAADPVNAIVEALNAEASLKDSKITVQPDGENMLLTGVAQTQDQVKKASEIATAAAGGKTVVNVIVPDHTTYQAAQPASK